MIPFLMLKPIMQTLAFANCKAIKKRERAKDKTL